MSDFDYQPETGASFSIEPRILSSQMGDGYSQDIADGINNKLEKWNLTFSRETAAIDAIEAFLRSKGGTTTFTWTPSGRTEIKVKCRQWSYSYNGGAAKSLTCVFEQVPA
jgi:phage-related protein